MASQERVANTSPLLIVSGLTTHLNSPRGLVRAVDGVSFSLDRGRMLGIVGESGSGKSMLLKSILNLAPQGAFTSGEVWFEGVDLRKLTTRELRKVWGNEIAIVLQDPTGSLNPVLRIERQLTEGLRHHRHVRRKSAKTTALALMSSVGIAEPERRLRQYPGELSGGMLQRVAIAIALSCDPKLLLADEVTSSLDATVGARILDLVVTEQRRRDMSVILVTHDIGVVAGKADVIVVMYGGKVMEQGPVVDVLAQPRHPYTEALLSCVPRLSDPHQSRRTAIPGQPVDLVDPPPGCRFAPRCRYAQTRCHTEEPPLVEGEPGRQYACFFPRTQPGEEPTSAPRFSASSRGG